MGGLTSIARAPQIAGLAWTSDHTRNLVMGHSTIFGGSTASRLLECPGSFQAILSLPPQIEIESDYAAEGTALHEVMAHLMNARRLKPDADLFALALDCMDQKFYDRIVTAAHLADLIMPALQALDELERHYGGGFEVAEVERSVAFPGIIGAHGTVDLILRSATCVLHVDWKFGAGVPVAAVTRDDKGERVNAQLMFYVTAARHSARHLYSGRPTLVGAVIQPRSEAPLSHTVITPRDIKWFREDAARAVLLAIAPGPPRAKGEHCRWAPCKATCPLWTGPVLDLSALEGQAPREPVSADHREASAYGEYLARAKTLADQLALFKKEIDEQLHAFLEGGGTVPGWRLKAKVKQRQWVDDEVVEYELKKLGFATDEIFQRRLVTFQSADATARRRKVVIPDDLRVAPPTGETTIATTDDPAPIVERRLQVERFREALAALQAPGNGNRLGLALLCPQTGKQE
jgi:Protein of unknown function (DUF2800)